MNFADILSVAADRAPHHEAVRAGDRCLTYRGLKERALAVGELLRGSGVRRGDVIAILSGNRLEFCEIVYGAVGIGALVVLVNPRFAAREIEYVLGNAGVGTLFHEQTFAGMMTEIVLPSGLTRYTIDKLASSTEAPCYLDSLPAGDVSSEFVDMNPTDDCLIIYTSGTTGKPKGAVHSHSSCMSAASLCNLNIWEQPLTAGLLYPLPMASIGFVTYPSSCIYRGMRLEIMEKFDPERTLQLIHSGRVSHTQLVPSMWKMMLEVENLDSYDVSALQFGGWAGEPMPDTVRSRVTDHFGPVLAGSWGSTESGSARCRPAEDQARPGTCGRPVGATRVRIVDDDEVEVPRGQVGELICKSPFQFTRYYKDPGATAAVLRDGWYHTGDLARMDEDGYMWIVGRSKDMVISGGQNIYPAEIEAVLHQHPAVKAAAVVGAPDAKWGETPVAFVVLYENQTEDSQHLANWCRNRLAHYKTPRHWRFIAGLPINNNGKVDKAQLRDIAYAQIGTQC
jgi:fatty-acyl-CoA synthase